MGNQKTGRWDNWLQTVVICASANDNGENRRFAGQFCHIAVMVAGSRWSVISCPFKKKFKALERERERERRVL